MWHRLGKGGAKYWGKRGAGLILTDGKSILLLKRGDKGDYAGHWCVPGGKVEDGETFLGGAQRETREETGSLPNCTRLGTFDNQDGRFIFKSFLCRIDKPYEVKISDESTDSKWVPLDELMNMKLHPKLREILPSVLRTIKDKVGGTEISESVIHTGAMMRIGPYAIFEMEKYIHKHQTKLNEAWPFGGGGSPPPPPPPAPLTPRAVNPQVASFIPHIASALNLPTPIPPAVMKALTSIVSRVAPEPHGTGGMLQLNWFRTIMTSVWDAEAARVSATGDPIDPHSPSLAPAKNPVQILHAIRAEMPNEEFHSKVTLEGGGNKKGSEHDQHFMDQSRRYEYEMHVKHKLRAGRGSGGGGGGGGGGGSPPPGSGGGSPVPQLDAKAFAFFKALPKDIWMDGGALKDNRTMVNLMNQLAHGVGSTVTWGSNVSTDITQILVGIGAVATAGGGPPTP